MPADGMSVAMNIRKDFGTSDWQLDGHYIPLTAAMLLDNVAVRQAESIMK
ncbi:hypothetical protein [Bradyrhizobium sp.]|nr:hypothetical protein [Bradyrhizobium sp.]MBV8923318.1 hypothetical protein [Bradyrhizobium sp.]MBV9982593.1 hypothetical protein [Bradyrhizobium sp.]